MQPSPRRRLFAALFGVWFLVAGREPPFPHPCEMGSVATAAHHGGPSGPGKRAQHHEAQETGGHEGHDHAQHSAAPDQLPGDTPTGTCECVGECCGVPIPQAPLATVTLATVETRIRVVAICAKHQRVATATPFALPYPIGPPAALS